MHVPDRQPRGPAWVRGGMVARGGDACQHYLRNAAYNSWPRGTDKAVWATDLPRIVRDKRGKWGDNGNAALHGAAKWDAGWWEVVVSDVPGALTHVRHRDDVVEIAPRRVGRPAGAAGARRTALNTTPQGPPGPCTEIDRIGDGQIAFEHGDWKPLRRRGRDTMRLWLSSMGLLPDRWRTSP